MTLSNRDPWMDSSSTLLGFPDHVLLDIARNDSAEHRYRKLATEILVTRKSLLTRHPDLQRFLIELEVELSGIQFEHPAPSSGPLVASITTETMFSNSEAPSVQTEASGIPPVQETEKEIPPSGADHHSENPTPPDHLVSKEPSSPVPGTAD